MVQVLQLIPSPLRSAYEASALSAGDDRAALCAARLALLQGLAKAGVVVDTKDMQEYFAWVAAGRWERVAA